MCFQIDRRSSIILSLCWRRLLESFTNLTSTSHFHATLIHTSLRPFESFNNDTTIDKSIRFPTIICQFHREQTQVSSSSSVLCDCLRCRLRRSAVDTADSQDRVSPRRSSPEAANLRLWHADPRSLEQGLWCSA
jgi:hypothetical protein